MSETNQADDEATEEQVALEHQDGSAPVVEEEEDESVGANSPEGDDNDDKDDETSRTDSDSDAEDFSPTDDPSDLVVQATTLKEEGNSFFKEGDLVKASRSYRKGTSMLKKLNKNNTGDDQVKALLVSLQNNLSMVCFKQDKHKLSRDVANKALAVDPNNVKALYRRAVANRKLGDLDEARKDLKEALKQDPENVAVKKELALVKRDIDVADKKAKKQLQKAFSSKSGSFLYNDKEEEKKRKEEERKKREEEAKEALKRRKLEWEDECVKRMADNQEAVSFEDWEKEQEKAATEAKRLKEEEEKRLQEERRKTQAAAKPSKPATDEESDEDDELTEKELAMLRGYKKTSDGRTTSYFTRELPEHEKKMLGDIAPKRLDESTGTSSIEPAPLPSPAAATQQTKMGTASAWNQAGTWEEKDATSWCSSHLRSKLGSTTLQEGSYMAAVKSVKQLTGDASVAITGGKKRYIFDFHCKLDFEIFNVDDEEVLCSGSLSLPDICSTSHDELEVDVLAWTKVPDSEHKSGAETCRGSLVQQVRLSVQEFVADFNAHY
jgi:tetratricopeptide (TPR) repeat protein